MFQRAVKHNLWLRQALIGPPGAGKTMTGLLIAKQLGGPIAVLDTESGSARKYAGDPGLPDFDVMELTKDFNPQHYIEALEGAAEEGYNVILIDSLSHAWAGEGGILTIKDKTKGNNDWAAWRNVTPLHNKLIDALLNTPIHVLATMRVKTQYVQQLNPRTNKQEIVKLGTQPIQRDGLEYEFDIVTDLLAEDGGNSYAIGKTRCPTIRGMQGRVEDFDDVTERVKRWLQGEPSPQDLIDQLARLRQQIRDLGAEPEERLSTKTIKAMSVAELLQHIYKCEAQLQTLTHVEATDEDDDSGRME